MYTLNYGGWLVTSHHISQRNWLEWFLCCKGIKPTWLSKVFELKISAFQHLISKLESTGKDGDRCCVSDERTYVHLVEKKIFTHTRILQCYLQAQHLKTRTTKDKLLFLTVKIYNGELHNFFNNHKPTYPTIEKILPFSWVRSCL